MATTARTTIQSHQRLLALAGGAAEESRAPGSGRSIELSWPIRSLLLVKSTGRVILPGQSSGGTHWGIPRQPFERTAKDSLRIDRTVFGGKWLRSTVSGGTPCGTAQHGDSGARRGWLS